MKSYRERIKTTKQGYEYIKVKPEEIFNWGGACICDNCGEIKVENSYLIFVLGRCICSECFKEWEQRAVKFEEDLKLQEECADKWFKYHLDRR